MTRDRPIALSLAFASASACARDSREGESDGGGDPGGRLGDERRSESSAAASVVVGGGVGEGNDDGEAAPAPRIHPTSSTASTQRRVGLLPGLAATLPSHATATGLAAYDRFVPARGSSPRGSPPDAPRTQDGLPLRREEPRQQHHHHRKKKTRK